MRLVAAPVAFAAPLLRPSDPPGPAAADGRPGRFETRAVVGPLGAFGPHGGAVPPAGAALLDAAVPPGVAGPLDGSGLHDAGEPPGGAGPPVGSGHPDAFGCPAACGRLAAAARRATELLRVAASLVSELPAFGLWLHHSEDSAACQTWELES